MKRILFVIDTLGSGGGQKSLINFLHELDPSASGLQVDLLMFARRGLFLGQLPNYVNVLPTPREISCMFEPFGSKEFLSGLCPKGLFGKLKRLAFKTGIQRKNPALNDIQLFWQVWKPVLPNLQGFYDIAVGGLEGTCSYYVMDKVGAQRKVLWFHNNYANHGYNAGFDHAYFERADAIATVSEECLESLKRAFPDLSGKFHILENITSRKTVESRSLEPADDARTEGVLNLLTVGRLFPVKGYDLLVGAAKILVERDIKFIWRCLGEGELADEIQRWINDTGLGECVLLMGARENPYPYMRQCDFFVQTSRYEGKSIVLDEAKMLCKPIIVTDYATAVDAIKDGETGLICEMSSEGIADAIQRLYMDHSLMMKLEDNLARSEGDCGSSVADYLEVYLGR